MADDHVLHQHAQLGRKIGQPLQLLVQQAQADHDVAQQLPFRAVAEAAVVGQFGHLADVVQNHAGEQQIEIDVAIVRGRSCGHSWQSESTCSINPPRNA